VDRSEPSHRDDIAAEAALWYARLDSGSADTEAFETWRAESPLHAAAFARIAATDLALDRVSGLALQNDPDLRPRPILSRRGLLSAAAVALVGLIAGGVWFASAERASASTPVGGRKTVVLPDGGKIELNTDTKVSWKFDASSRRIWLERGEANVLVVSDHRPCSVVAGDMTVILSQGNLNARLNDRAVAIAVLKGDCAVSSGHGAGATATRVATGQATVSSAGLTRVHSLTDDDIQSISAWQKDELVFTGQTLSAAVDEYNRYLTRKLEIADPSIADIQLGGRFKTTDPQAFLAALQSSFGVQVKQEADGAIALSR